MAVSSTAIRQVVSAANANTPNSPAAPNIPAPRPALLPFSDSSAFASSSSLLTSVLVCSESCLSSSPTGFSCRSWSVPGASAMPHLGNPGPAGLRSGRRGQPGALGERRRGHVAVPVREPVRSAEARPGGAAVPLAARRLEEARGQEPDGEPAGDHGPGLTASQVLHVV